MANSLYPAFMRLNYASPFGPHSMQVPLAGLVADGSFPAGWAIDGGSMAAPIDFEDTAAEIADLLKVYLKSDSSFVDATGFTLADPDATPVPRVSVSLGIAGTNTGTTQRKAVQMTYTWRTSAFGIFKLVLLDAVSGGDFDKTISIGDVGSPTHNIHDYVTDPDNGIRGRDGGVPTTFLQLSVTLNEKLRRSYRMN